jgi:AcrR family transcriptional regulator
MVERRPRTRSTYHHGDLRAALIEAGTNLARGGGPQAIVLREVTRIVGVAPNSAYGHFSTLPALKTAVSEKARGVMGEAMEARIDAAAATEPAHTCEAAKKYLREVGRAYVRFALAEPGLFRTAMGGDPTGLRVPGAFRDAPTTTDDNKPLPKLFLLRALTRLVDAGCLHQGELAKAVTASWATVHGLSIMLLDLLPPAAPEEADTIIDDALDVLIAGLTAARDKG